MKRNSVWGITLKAGTIQTTQVFGSRKEAEDAIAKISHLSNGFEAVELGSVNSPELPDGWIPCAERMPPDGEDVVCATEFFGPGDWRRKVGHYRQNGEWRVYGASWTPSHWQPLPAPPTTEK